MTAAEDPRTSDAATGMPPLEQVDPADALLVTTWHASEGLAFGPTSDEPIAVRYLSLRGLICSAPGSPHLVEWGQIHIAVPVEHALDVAAALAKGTTEELGGRG